MGRGTSELPTEQKVAESSHSARRKRVDPCGALRLRNDMERERNYKDCHFFLQGKTTSGRNEQIVVRLLGEVRPLCGLQHFPKRDSVLR